MKRVSPATKMRVLGAIEFAPGRTIKGKIDHVSSLVFKDEEGDPLQFSRRTIQTWYSRYQKDGITSMKPKPRSDRGRTRKVEAELVQEAIDRVLPHFRGPTNLAAIYRACIEKNLLQREQVAPNTFRRIVARYDLLKPPSETENKARLAFSKAHANQLWQADTICGPYVSHQGKKLQAKLIAFIDDASRVCCHGQFFAAENTDTLLAALKTALYKRGVPECLYVDNGSIYASKELGQVCGRLGCILSHAPVRDGAAKGRVERFFRTVRESFLTRNLDLSSVDALNRAFFRFFVRASHPNGPPRRSSPMGTTPRAPLTICYAPSLRRHGDISRMGIWEIPENHTTANRPPTTTPVWKTTTNTGCFALKRSAPPSRPPKSGSKSNAGSARTHRLRLGFRGSAPGCPGIQFIRGELLRHRGARGIAIIGIRCGKALEVFPRIPKANAVCSPR
jgi:transposase InsO family protein